MRAVKKVSPVIVKNETKDLNKSHIEFEDSSMLGVEKKPLHKTTAREVFKPKKKTKKLSINTRPAYSARDITISLSNVSIDEHTLNLPDHLVKVYLKKTATWSALVSASTIALAGINVLTAELLNLNMGGYAILGVGATAAITSYSYSIFKTTHIKNQYEIYNTSIELHDSSVLLNLLLEQIYKLFNFDRVKTLLTLKPEIKIAITNGEPHLHIGLPLLHSLSYIELISLVAYNVSAFKMLNQKHISLLFGHESLQPFTNMALQSSLDKMLSAPTNILKNEIIQRSLVNAVQVTDFQTTIDAFYKQELLKEAFNSSIRTLTTEEILPINMVTQIICASESHNTKHQTESLHISDQIKSYITNYPHGLELKHKPCQILHNFPSNLLIKNINTHANTLSIKTLQKLGFNDDQLIKTHTAHTAFKDQLTVDPVNRYYSNFYRVNRSIIPDLSESNAGSLMTLKSDLLSLNNDISSAAPNHLPRIKLWDSKITPYSIKNKVNTTGSINLEKAHIELNEIETLFGKKTGRCIAMTLSIGTPQEQKTIYSLLNAHRKALNLLRTQDALIEALYSFKAVGGKEKFAMLKQTARQVMGLAGSLPPLSSASINMQEKIKYTEKVLQARSSDEVSHGILDLITTIEDYKWHADLQIISICEKVEERLGAS